MHRVIRLFRNKYFLTTTVFFVWLLFFDSNNLINQFDLSSTISDMAREKEFYMEEIEKNRSASEKLLNDREVLEKFAREKYLMKKENEDIFIIVRE